MKLPTRTKGKTGPKIIERPAPTIIITRDEAIRLRIPRYFDGKPCKWGHVAERTVSRRACTECHRRLSRVDYVKPTPLPLTDPQKRRAEADALGMKRYSPGVACIHGHIADRYVTTNTCVECDNQSSHRRRQAQLDENERRRRDDTREAQRLRAEAKGAGSAYFFTGRPCKRGHVCERFVSNGACLACATALSRASRRRDPIKHRGYVRGYRERNPGKFDESGRLWRKRNRSHLATYNRRWGKANPDKIKQYQQARHARKRGSGGHISAAEIRELFALQKGRCAYCRRKLNFNCRSEWHVDHRKALTRGGEHHRRNAQICCAHCNQEKSANDEIEYARKRHGRLL